MKIKQSDVEHSLQQYEKLIVFLPKCVNTSLFGSDKCKLGSILPTWWCFKGLGHRWRGIIFWKVLLLY